MFVTYRKIALTIKWPIPKAKNRKFCFNEKKSLERLVPIFTLIASTSLICNLLSCWSLKDSFALICIGLAGFGFFGFAAYPMALELAAEAIYPIDSSMSESWVHVNVQVSDLSCCACSLDIHKVTYLNINFSPCNITSNNFFFENEKVIIKSLNMWSQLKT